MSDHDKVQDDQKPEPADGSVSKERREAMKTLGRYAAYTAPAMLLLFESEKAAAVS